MISPKILYNIFNQTQIQEKRKTMSIEKVEHYKQDKFNRKKIMKKQKRHKILIRLLLIIIALAILVFLVWSIYGLFH